MSISSHNINVPGVYYLETENPRMNPIAIRVGLTDPDYIFWEDTGNETESLVAGRDCEKDCATRKQQSRAPISFCIQFFWKCLNM